jgi:hypothetical protein
MHADRHELENDDPDVGIVPDDVGDERAVRPQPDLQRDVSLSISLEKAQSARRVHARTLRDGGSSSDVAGTSRRHGDGGEVLGRKAMSRVEEERR